MRSTMREDSVRRKPTRSTSRPKRQFGTSQTRHDSLSPARGAMTRTPSPHDASLAAKTAQMQITPPAAVYNARREPSSSTDEPSLPIYDSMRSRWPTTTTAGPSSEPDPEQGHKLSDLGSQPARSGSYRSTTSLMPKAKGHRRQKLTGKVKDGLSSVAESYSDVWKQRKDHVSDEHVAVRAIVDFVQSRHGKKRTGSPAPQGKFGTSLPHVRTHDKIAWPPGQGIPLDRAPTPPPFESPRLHDKPLTPPQAAYTSGRDRNPSVYTTKTTWSQVMGARNHDHDVPDVPPPHPFAGAFTDMSKGKGKGKFRYKADLAIQTQDLPYSHWRPKPNAVHGSDAPPADADLAADQDRQRAWNRDQHAFDPDRESYTSAEPARRFRSNYAASSIYSQPEAEPDLSKYPTPPPIPGEYLSHAITTDEARPVSPLTSNTSISAFFTPARPTQIAAQQATGQTLSTAQPPHPHLVTTTRKAESQHFSQVQTRQRNLNLDHVQSHVTAARSTRSTTRTQCEVRSFTISTAIAVLSFAVDLEKKLKLRLKCVCRSVRVPRFDRVEGQLRGRLILALLT